MSHLRPEGMQLNSIPNMLRSNQSIPVWFVSLDLDCMYGRDLNHHRDVMCTQSSLDQTINLVNVLTDIDNIA